jgi:hypothetical protein
LAGQINALTIARAMIASARCGAVRDCETRILIRERIDDPAVSLKQFGESNVAPSEITLELCVVGVGCGQALHDGEAGAVLVNRSFEIALREQDSADSILRD